MNKIIISTPLLKFTNNVKTLDLTGDSYFNLYSNLTNLFPDLRRVTNELKTNKSMDIWLLVDGKVLRPEHVFLNPKKDATIVVIPLITGGGDSLGSIAIGLAFVAIAVVMITQPYMLAAAAGFTSSIGSMIGAAGVISSVGGGIMSIGASMLLSGVISALSPPKAPNAASASNDSSVRAENGVFEGLRNTTSTQTPIPLIYGQHRVPGQFIGGKIKTINHDKNTVISVANYV